MRKITLLFAALIAANFSLKAQNFPYNFSVSSATYTPLDNAVSLNQGTPWDDPDFTLPLGFPFGMFGNTGTNLYISEMFLGGFINTGLNAQGKIQTFMLTFADLVDGGYNGFQSLSEISYKIEQTAGGKIFKLEYNDAGFYSEVLDSNTFNNKMSAQVWFYENSNDIEVHFGPSSIPNPEIAFEGFDGPMMGFLENMDFNTGVFDHIWYLYGSTSNPDINYIDINGFDTLQHVLVGQPTEGTVYKFAAIIPASVKENAASVSQSLVYPTVTASVLNVVNVAPENGYTITSISGQIVAQRTSTEGIIDVSALTPGAYFIRFDGETAPHKFVKQ